MKRALGLAETQPEMRVILRNSLQISVRYTVPAYLRVLANDPANCHPVPSHALDYNDVEQDTDHVNNRHVG